MARAQGIDDLFGHVPQQDELAIEDAGESRQSGLEAGGVLLRTPHEGHTPDTIRSNLLAVIAHARAAAAMPWDARDLRYFTGIVPYMAEWLKGGEGDGLLAEFKAEMDRLGAPADQVAPNWRRIWGIAA